MSTCGHSQKVKQRTCHRENQQLVNPTCKIKGAFECRSSIWRSMSAKMPHASDGALWHGLITTCVWKTCFKIKAQKLHEKGNDIAWSAYALHRLNRDVKLQSTAVMPCSSYWPLFWILCRGLVFVAMYCVKTKRTLNANDSWKSHVPYSHKVEIYELCWEVLVCAN